MNHAYSEKLRREDHNSKGMGGFSQMHELPNTRPRTRVEHANRRELDARLRLVHGQGPATHPTYSAEGSAAGPSATGPRAPSAARPAGQQEVGVSDGRALTAG